MSRLTSSLERTAALEILHPLPDGAQRFVETIRERFGPAVDAVLFYGSCLRRGDTEGVLDFYVLVDDYARAYPSARALPFVNRLMPPNVFYLERGGARAKVAVISTRDFLRHAEGHGLRPFVWSRFCQPFSAPYLRDEGARETVIAAAVCAMRTAVVRGLGLVPAPGGRARFRAEAFWTTLFRETYASEVRPERDATVRRLAERDPPRYAAVLESNLIALAEEGRLSWSREGDVLVVGEARALLSRRRRARRSLARAIGALQLLKTAFTFGDWMPYALWKLERHTGRPIEASPRQRRHPLLFAWPLVFRALARRDLR